MGLLGSLVTGIFGGKKPTTSGKATTNSTTTASPYAPAIPFLNDYLSNASTLYNGGAPQISPTEQQGYDLLNQTVHAPGTIDPAIAENNKTLSGQYLDPNQNPYLMGIANRMGGAAGAAANTTFGGHGRTGSGLHELNFGQGVANAVGDVYNQNYQAERGRMAGAVGMAPGLEAGRYLGPQALISAGQNISARPFDIANQYGGLLEHIAGLGGTQTTSGTQTQQNYKQTGGLLSTIANSFINKLFPGG